MSRRVPRVGHVQGVDLAIPDLAERISLNFGPRWISVKKTKSKSPAEALAGTVASAGTDSASPKAESPISGRAIGRARADFKNILRNMR